MCTIETSSIGRVLGRPGAEPLLWRLTGPIALQNLITFSLGLIDTLMVSWLGNTQMAAVTTANVPVFLLISIVFGVQSGLGILVSQYWGKKDMESISRAIGVAAMLGTGITLVLALVLFLWPVQIMDLLSNKHELSVLGAPYLKLIGFSYVFNMLSSIYVSAMRSAENPGFGMKLFGMSTVINTGMNYLLIFGKAGFPMLGVEGAAVATLISRVAAAMPTPRAPPKTESTVRSMPALDSPIKTPRIKKPTRHNRPTLQFCLNFFRWNGPQSVQIGYTLITILEVIIR